MIELIISPIHTKLYYRHFMQADAKKFHDVWVMNEEDLKEKVSGITEADRIIHTQQMGLIWRKPDE